MLRNRNRRSVFRTPQQPKAKWGFCPASARLLILGEILILLAICDFAARLYTYETAGAVGSILLMSDIGGSLSASAVILWAAGLGLDYLERTCPKRE